MNHHAIPAIAAVFVLCLSTMPAGARAASLDLPGGCAVVSSAGLHEGGAGHGVGFDATRLNVLLPGTTLSSLHAARLHGAAQGGAIGAPQLEPAATAAAVGVLTALAGHRDEPCPDRVLENAAAPLVHALQQGGRAEFTWQDMSVRAGGARFGAHRLTLHIDADGALAHLTAVADGMVSNDPSAGLLPGSLSIRASLPVAELPALLSAAGGHGSAVDLTIEQVDARRGDTVLSGHGQATVGSTPDTGSGQGHITVHGFDALLDAAGAPGLARIRTALFLAKLVAHRQGDQVDWDLLWQQGTLMVNNVPLPLR